MFGVSQYIYLLMENVIVKIQSYNKILHKTLYSSENNRRKKVIFSNAMQSTNCNISKKTFLFFKTCKSINPRIMIHSKDILAQAQKYNVIFCNIISNPIKYFALNYLINVLCE